MHPEVLMPKASKAKILLICALLPALLLAACGRQGKETSTGHKKGLPATLPGGAGRAHPGRRPAAFQRKPPRAVPDPPYLASAKALARKGLFEQAAHSLEPILPAHPDDAALRGLVGQWLLKARHFNEGFDYLAQAHNLAPDNPEYLFNMATCRFNQSLFKEALSYFRELEGMGTPNLSDRIRAGIAFNRGLCAKELDLIPEALESLGRAVSLAGNPRDEERFRLELGGAYLDHGKYAEAEEQFGKLGRLNPGQGDYPYYEGVAYLEQGQLKPAEDALLAARRLKPKDFHVLVKLGNLYFQQNKLNEAEGFYMEALERNPKADEALKQLGQINRRNGDTDTARDYDKRYHQVKDKASALTEELRTLRRRVLANNKDLEAHKRRIEIFLRYDKQANAHKALMRMLAAFPRNDWGLLNMAYLLQREGQPREAAFTLKKLLEVDPENRFANRDMARLLHSQKRFGQALPYWARALAAFKKEQKPDLKAELQCIQGAADAYVRLGGQAQAIPYYEQMAPLLEQLGDKKNAAKVHQLLSQYYKQAGNDEQFRRHLAAAARLGNG